MGVFLPIDLTSKSPAEGLFQSNDAIASLRGSKANWNAWRRQAGRKTCSAKLTATKPRRQGIVHGTLRKLPQRLALSWTEPNKYGKRFVLVGLTPQSYVGTEPQS